jgi:hypothetical protein
LSYEKSKLSQSLFSGSNANLISLFQRLGSSLLRIGGNSVDETNWNPAGPGLTAGETAPSDVDRLAAFLSAAGWPVLYGVNLAQSTPAAAASEIAYAATALGSNLFGIEIGNEVDLYPGHYFPTTWDFSDYLALWQSFASAILAQTPGVPLTGPVTASNASWFTQFAQAEGKNVVLLSMHYYRGNGQSPSSTIETLLSYPDTNLQKDLIPLQAAATAAGVPYRMAETNSFYNVGAPNVSDSYASALWVIDHLFTIAQGGSVGANLHGGGDSTGYTPIADNDGVVVEARPEYYGALLFTLAGQGPLLTTTIDAGSLNVSAYTIQNSPNRLSLILVNKDATQNLQFTATCPAAVQSATLQLLTGPSLSATSGVTIQGSPVNPDGSFEWLGERARAIRRPLMIAGTLHSYASGSQELEDEQFVFGAQHGSHAHLTNHCARFARRQVLRRVVAPSAIRAESFRAFCGFVYFRRSLLRARIRLLRMGAASQCHKQH